MIKSPIASLLWLSFVGILAGCLCDKPNQSWYSSVTQNPTTTTQILCADQRLSDAMNKCKSSVTMMLPMLLNQNGGGGDGDDKQRALMMALMAKGMGGSTPSAPPGNGCPRQSDAGTSCNDDLITTMMLWQSAHKNDGSPAMSDPWYQKYLMSRVQGFVADSAKEMKLGPIDMLKVGTALSAALSQGALRHPAAGAFASVTGALVDRTGGAPQFAAGSPPKVTGPPQVTTPRLSDGKALAMVGGGTGGSAFGGGTDTGSTGPRQTIGFADLHEARNVGLKPSAIPAPKK